MPEACRAEHAALTSRLELPAAVRACPLGPIQFPIKLPRAGGPVEFAEGCAHLDFTSLMRGLEGVGGPSAFRLIMPA